MLAPPVPVTNTDPLPVVRMPQGKPLATSARTPIWFPPAAVPPRPLSRTVPDPLDTSEVRTSTPTKSPSVGVACWLADRVMSPLVVVTCTDTFTTMFRVVVTVRLFDPKYASLVNTTVPGESSSVTANGFVKAEEEPKSTLVPAAESTTVTSPDAALRVTSPSVELRRRYLLVVEPAKMTRCSFGSSKVTVLPEMVTGVVRSSSGVSAGRNRGRAGADSQRASKFIMV